MPVICCWSRLQGRPGTQHVCVRYRMGEKKHYVFLVYISKLLVKLSLLKPSYVLAI
jgi:hypothetical protein